MQKIVDRLKIFRIVKFSHVLEVYSKLIP